MPEPIPTENLLGDHYSIQMKLVCDEGVTTRSATVVVGYEEYYDLTINAKEGGIVLADLLTHERVVEDTATFTSVGRGNEIELEAHPEPGMRFEEWSGDISGDDPVINIRVFEDMEIEAHFEEEKKKQISKWK